MFVREHKPENLIYECFDYFREVFPQFLEFFKKKKF
jgi:hypothetical protein